MDGQRDGFRGHGLRVVAGLPERHLRRQRAAPHGRTDADDGHGRLLLGHQLEESLRSRIPLRSSSKQAPNPVQPSEPQYTTRKIQVSWFLQVPKLALEYQHRFASTISQADPIPIIAAYKRKRAPPFPAVSCVYVFLAADYFPPVIL